MLWVSILYSNKTFVQEIAVYVGNQENVALNAEKTVSISPTKTRSLSVWTLAQIIDGRIVEKL